MRALSRQANYYNRGKLDKTVIHAMIENGKHMRCCTCAQVPHREDVLHIHIDSVLVILNHGPYLSQVVAVKLHSIRAVSGALRGRRKPGQEVIEPIEHYFSALIYMLGGRGHWGARHRLFVVKMQVLQSTVRGNLRLAKTNQIFKRCQKDKDIQYSFRPAINGTSSTSNSGVGVHIGRGYSPYFTVYGRG